MMLRRVALLSLPLAVLGGLTGCETNGWLIDPQRTGYFQTTPTAIPILTRIDVIEQAADTSIVYTSPSAEDLVPNDLEYKLAPGDVIKVSIPQLISSDQTDISTRVIDQSGRISRPIIGQLPAAGLTVEQLEKGIVEKLGKLITNPKAFVSVEEARGAIASGVASGGMIPKLQGCVAAVDGGVGAAHVLDGTAPHALLVELFTDGGIGTMITAAG